MALSGAHTTAKAQQSPYETTFKYTIQGIWIFTLDLFVYHVPKIHQDHCAIL